MTGLGILDRPKTGPDLSDGKQDSDALAHIVDDSKWDITEAIVMGTEVEALCGYRWVPSRDPTVYPTCPECYRVYSEMT